MEDLENATSKRRRFSDKSHTTFRTYNNNFHEQTPTQCEKNELEFDDLRHESLNQILKHNMEILKHSDMHNFDDSIDDDENNNDNSLSGESLTLSSTTTRNCVGQDLIGMTECGKDDDDDTTTLVQFNQLIDDERESEMNEDDGVSFIYTNIFNYLAMRYNIT